MRPCRILIVDDDPWIVDIIGELLRDEGHTTVIAHTGEEALKIARQSPPDLLLLDLKLPGIGGKEVIRELQRAKVDIPIVVLTATPYPPAWGTPLNVAAYLAKPFDIVNLLALVERFCPDLTPQPIG